MLGAWVLLETNALGLNGQPLRHTQRPAYAAATPTRAMRLAMAAGAEDAQGISAHWGPEPSSSGGWGSALRSAAVAGATAAVLLGGDARVALAENELAALAGDQFHSELVKPECFATSCKTQTKACAENGDCMKGLACTAKCMGDAQCTVGCFARYGNTDLDNMLQCTIEDKGCINIAIMEPGNDSPLEAPLPPKALVRATPASMQGKWYKVLGWNPNYDCFDCQRNSFGAADASRPTQGTQRAIEVGSTGVDVEVEYAMARNRIDQAPQLFQQTLHEKLQFDTTPGSRRTAHTEGKMFGLTFWENWYVIGQNKPSEPQFRFVYYTGKTLQNRYEGAFVYARTPELPKDAMPSIYKVAREAGMDPTRFCCVDNTCFDGANGPPASAPPLFTPVAEAADDDVMPARPAAAAPPSAYSLMPPGVRQFALDAAEILEDPRPASRELFGKQRQMSEVREFDANGFRVPLDVYSQR